MSINSPELQMKIAGWRQKAAEGTLSLEDCKEYVTLMREGRMSSSVSSAATKRKKAIKEIPDAKDILSGLEGL